MTLTSSVLLVASLLRFGWESRPIQPILPPSEVPAQLVEETRAAVERVDRRNTPLGPGEKIDPNRDAEVELARIPGIGPSLAERIVESRNSEGTFHGAEDLLRISGIGPVTLERMRPHLDLASPPSGSTRPRERTPMIPGSQARSSMPSALRLDLNRATAEDLEGLPGIGPALAKRIADYREEVGLYRSVRSLLDVPGVGPATVERLSALVEAGP